MTPQAYADSWGVPLLAEIPARGHATARDWGWATEGSLDAPGRNHPVMGAWIVDRYCPPNATCADPMIAVGGLWIRADRSRARRVYGAELEPIGLLAQRNLDPHNRGRALVEIEADAKGWAPPEPVDFAQFSPPYDEVNHDSGKCESQVNLVKSKGWQTFQAFGGSPQNIGRLTGAAYWRAIRRVYRKVASYVKHGAHVVVIVRNHIREGREVDRVRWHIRLLELVGLVVLGVHPRALRPGGPMQMKVSRDPSTPWTKFEFAVACRKAGV